MVEECRLFPFVLQVVKVQVWRKYRFGKIRLGKEPSGSVKNHLFGLVLPGFGGRHC